MGVELTFNFALVPVAIALVEVFKLFFPTAEDGLNARALRILDGVKFLLSLLIGVGLVFLTDNVAVKQLILQGLLVGLTASGLYSGGKAGINTVKELVKPSEPMV